MTQFDRGRLGTTPGSRDRTGVLPGPSAGSFPLPWRSPHGQPSHCALSCPALSWLVHHRTPKQPSAWHTVGAHSVLGLQLRCQVTRLPPV